MCLQIAYQRLWTRKSQCHTAESMAFDHDKNGQRSDLASLEWHAEARTLAQDLLHPGSCFHVAPAFFRISHPQGPSPSRSRSKVFSYKSPSLVISPLALAQPGFWQLCQQSSWYPSSLDLYNLAKSYPICWSDRIIYSSWPHLTGSCLSVIRCTFFFFF